jgi:hypothetical protein
MACYPSERRVTSGRSCERGVGEKSGVDAENLVEMVNGQWLMVNG